MGTLGGFEDWSPNVLCKRNVHQVACCPRINYNACWVMAIEDIEVRGLGYGNKVCQTYRLVRHVWVFNSVSVSLHGSYSPTSSPLQSKMVRALARAINFLSFSGKTQTQTQTQTEFYSTSIEIKSVTSGCKNNMVENKR